MSNQGRKIFCPLGIVALTGPVAEGLIRKF